MIAPRVTAAVAVAILACALPLPTVASVVVSLLAAAGGMTGIGAKGALLGAVAVAPVVYVLGRALT